MSTCHHVIMGSCHHGIMSSCEHAIMGSCHHVNMPPWDHVIMSSCHHVIRSSCRQVIRSSCHHVIIISTGRYGLTWSERKRAAREKNHRGLSPHKSFPLCNIIIFLYFFEIFVQEEKGGNIVQAQIILFLIRIDFR